MPAFSPLRIAPFVTRSSRPSTGPRIWLACLVRDSAFTYAWNERHFPEQITQEGLQPHRVTEAYLWGSEDPDVFVDVADYLQMKPR